MYGFRYQGLGFRYCELCVSYVCVVCAVYGFRYQDLGFRYELTPVCVSCVCRFRNQS